MFEKKVSRMIHAEQTISLCFIPTQQIATSVSTFQIGQKMCKLITN